MLDSVKAVADCMLSLLILIIVLALACFSVTIIYARTGTSFDPRSCVACLWSACV